MSFKVKDLKKIIEHMSDDAIIHTQYNEDIVFMRGSDTLLLSTERPIGSCNRTGTHVFPTNSPGYAAYSPELDEDLYEFEFTKYE